VDSLNASRSPHALPSPLPTERGPENQAGPCTLPRCGLIQKQQKQREGKGKKTGGVWREGEGQISKPPNHMPVRGKYDTWISGSDVNVVMA
jgi:hypothetical protein